MKRITEDNTVSVLQKTLNYFKIPITNETIKNSLKSHPHYPTFKSICDVLEDNKIEHYPLQLNSNEIKDIEVPFIVHLKDYGGKIVFLYQIKNGMVYYYDSLKSKIKIGINEFLERCTGAVILLNPNENSGEEEYSLKRQNEILNNTVLPMAIGIAIFFTVIICIGFVFQQGLSINILQSFLFVTKMLGLILSVLLVLHEFDIHTTISDKLCNINKTTSCNAVLNTSASKLFGWFGWSDVGFIYFLGGLLVLLQSIKLPDYSILAIISAFSLPYPVFSIYYQGVVLKKWCPLCLGVQALLIVEFVLLFPQFKSLHISFTGTLNFIFTFTILVSSYLLVNMYYRKRQENEIHQQKYLKYKRDPEIFKLLLLKENHYIIPETNLSLVFGKKSADISITAFLSLHCSHCARAFNTIKYMLHNCKDIKINIALIILDEEKIKTLYYLNSQHREKEALECLESWYNDSSYSNSSISEEYCIPEEFNKINEFKNENHKLFEDCQVKATPTFFVNGYLLPRQYDLKDIMYYKEVVCETIKPVINRKIIS